MGEVVYRLYQDGDEVAINDGFNRVFGLHRSLEEWRWKFPAQPEGRWITVAVDETRNVLAQYGAVPVRMRLGPLEVLTGQIVDAFSVPEVRGKKVFSDLYEEFVRLLCHPQGLAVGFGFPGRRHYEMGLKRLRYVDLGFMPYFRRAALPVRRLPSLRYRLKKGFDGAAVDALWRRCSPRYPSATIRDAAWMSRRFTGRPGAAYLHLSVWSHGVVCAWGVARAVKETLRWVDLIWDGGNAGALAVLDRGLVRKAKQLECSSLDCWLRGDSEAERVVRALGWQIADDPQDVIFVARSFHPEIDLESLRHQLYLTLADSDLV